MREEQQEVTVHPFQIAMSQVWRVAMPKGVSASSFGASMALVPLAALLLGLAMTGLAWVAQDLPSEVVAALILILWVKLSGAQTLESVARVSDVTLGRSTANLQQLIDQPKASLGTVGVVMLVLTLLLKWALLVRVIHEGWWMVLVLMPVVGWVFGQMIMLGSRWSLPSLDKPDQWREHVNMSWLWPQWLLLLMALALASGWTLTFLVIATWAWVVWWRKQLKGVTDAVAFAWVESSELVWLMGLVWVMS